MGDMPIKELHHLLANWPARQKLAYRFFVSSLLNFFLIKIPENIIDNVPNPIYFFPKPIQFNKEATC